MNPRRIAVVFKSLKLSALLLIHSRREPSHPFRVSARRPTDRLFFETLLTGKKRATHRASRLTRQILWPHRALHFHFRPKQHLNEIMKPHFYHCKLKFPYGNKSLKNFRAKKLNNIIKIQNACKGWCVAVYMHNSEYNVKTYIRKVLLLLFRIWALSFERTIAKN
jgi:hypothetical protein